MIINHNIQDLINIKIIIDIKNNIVMTKANHHNIQVFSSKILKSRIAIITNHNHNKVDKPGKLKGTYLAA